MKKYCVTIDVKMSGDIYIEANSAAEAEKIAKERHFYPADLNNFHFLSSEVYDTTEEED